MPINNITQTISELPAAGRRGVDVQTQFVIKQEDFQDHLQGTTVTELNTLKDQLNTRIGEINSTTTTMNGYANTASAGASTATTKAGEASTSAGEALTSKNQASTFATNSSNSATKASQWADNNYNVAVEAEKYSAKHWATEAQNTVASKVDKVASTDNAIVRFDGTTGAVQNSGATIDDTGSIYQYGNQFNAHHNSPYTELVNRGPSGFQFYIDSASKIAMTVEKNGNLLVGTTTDNGVDKLQVNGSMSISDLNGSSSSFYRTIPFTPTLGGTWTINPTNLNGTVRVVGKIAFVTVSFIGGQKSSSTAGWIGGLPVPVVVNTAASMVDQDIVARGTALFSNSSRIFLTENTFGEAGVNITGFYITN